MQNYYISVEIVNTVTAIVKNVIFSELSMIHHHSSY